MKMTVICVEIGKKKISETIIVSDNIVNGTPLNEFDDIDDTTSSSPSMCGLFLCLGMDDPKSRRVNHINDSMVKSIKIIENLLGEPLRVVLDLKSRRVPPRVWARLIENLRARGLIVEGLGSFDVAELRSISECCATPITQILFFHSAGDLQRACHAKEVKYGDTVYFNAGSLLWQKPNFVEIVGRGCTTGGSDKLDQNELFIIQPYAHPRQPAGRQVHKLSSLQDYQRHYNLKIGLYVQEFSICEKALEVITKFINKHENIYNLGLAWGGLNGITITGMQGDGFWNQRFMGRNWDLEIGPTDKMEMKPEDQPAVRNVLLAGACGQVGTVNDETQEVLKEEFQYVSNVCAHVQPTQALYWS
mmetsp:Transcript_30422/g.37159  ORF Transcript_30422/g.37159 Transcript_30422/m.37159 type:complete len:361 (-) Transcript_30422:209-1291(-)